MTVAPPSTAAGFMASAPAAPPMAGSSPWAARYAEEIRRIFTEHAARAPRSQQVHLGPSEIGVECLHGDTEVVTRHGIRRIRDLAKDGSAELLVPLLYKGSDVRKRWGKFRRVPVEEFGERETYEITLRRGQDTKVVTATAGHNWFRTYWSGKNQKQQKLTTLELRPGHRLTQLRRARPLTTTLMPVAVAQGVVFGDGTKGTDDDRHRPAVLDLHHNGKDEALLKFFPGEHKVYEETAKTYPYSRVRGLPRFWKQLPPLDESTSFLMSWLAGYFAADGCVTEDGHCSISSAYEGHLEFVQSLASICGIGYGRVRKYMRRGRSGGRPASAETPIFVLTLRRWDLPGWFFLTERHAERVRAASLVVERDPHWTVEAVEATGRVEQVYCAITGEAGAFALADDLMTGNCHREVAGKLAGLPPTNHVIDPWPSIRGTALHTWAEGALLGDNARTGRARWYPERKVTPFEVRDHHQGHRGTADALDTDALGTGEVVVVDWKFLGPTSMDRIKRNGPPRKYRVQLKLYGLGYIREGAPVSRVALVAVPATTATLEPYVWEHQFTAADADELAYVEAELDHRKQWAAAILAGTASLTDVPATPGDECIWCPFYRPQSARDGGAGCPGNAPST